MKDKKEDDVIDELLRIPKKNLESRIKLLEEEIQQRKSISQQTLSWFGTELLRLEEQVWRLRYAVASSAESPERRELKGQRQRLEKQTADEMIACFRDISRLREKHQYACEELELEKQKLDLIGPEPSKAEDDNPPTENE